MSSTMGQQAGAARGDEEPMKVVFKNTFIHVEDKEVADHEALDIFNRRSGRNKTEPARLHVYDEDDGGDDTLNAEIGSHVKAASTPGGRCPDLPDRTPDHTTRLAMQAQFDGTSPFHNEVHAESKQPTGVASEGLPVRMASTARPQVMVTFPLDVPEGLENVQNLAASVVSVQNTTVAPNGSVVLDLRVVVGSSSLALGQPLASAAFPKGSICTSAPVASLRPDITGTLSAPVKSEAKNVTVCCHWKNKGFCKLGEGCKFMHPPNKQGVGSTRRKGGEAAATEAKKTTNGAANPRRSASNQAA